MTKMQQKQNFTRKCKVFELADEIAAKSPPVAMANTTGLQVLVRWSSVKCVVGVGLAPSLLLVRVVLLSRHV
jgi:hypothetical protein